MLSRREFLWGAAAASVLCPQPHAQQPDPGNRIFRHGVASGDPLGDRVILWTRLTPAGEAPLRSVEVRWRVASDAALTRVVRTGIAMASIDRDHTVKVDAGGLEPGATYYYAFESGGERSPIGRTRTLPASPTQLRFGVVSCANYPAGFFNVYRILANRVDLDAIVHVGDYIYEFANGVYGDGTALERLPQPLREAYTLQDYRMRYSTYRADPDLQEVHRQHPFIAVWDDHELANNAWSGGAENHHPERGQGDWATRRRAAYRAYMEWLPIREPAGTEIRLYRSVKYGTLADLVMLDARGLRDEQVAATDLEALTAVNRRMLGAVQEAWLRDTLRASQRANTRWRLLGQQVMFSRLSQTGRAVLLPDSWDGYQAERDRTLDFFQSERLTNVAILAGDMHSSWAFDVPKNPWVGYRSATGEGSLAVELVTPAVSSPGFFTPATAAGYTSALRAGLPHLKFLDGLERGYLMVDITPQRLRADWYFAQTVAERSSREQLAASFVCEAGSSRLAPA